MTDMSDLVDFMERERRRNQTALATSEWEDSEVGGNEVRKLVMKTTTGHITIREDEYNISGGLVNSYSYDPVEDKGTERKFDGLWTEEDFTGRRRF